VCELPQPFLLETSFTPINILEIRTETRGTSCNVIKHARSKWEQVVFYTLSQNSPVSNFAKI
jgi:hypothetical protein